MEKYDEEYRLKKDIITPEQTIPAGVVFHFFCGVGGPFDYDYQVFKSCVQDFDEWFEEVKNEEKLRKN